MSGQVVSPNRIKLCMHFIRFIHKKKSEKKGKRPKRPIPRIRH